MSQPPQFDSEPTSQRVPRFVPRRYPASSAVVVLLYIAAAIALVSWMASIALLIRAGGESGLPDYPLLPVLGGVMISTIGHGVAGMLFLFGAESIKIIIDIQQNTQRTSHYVSYRR